MKVEENSHESKLSSSFGPGLTPWSLHGKNTVDEQAGFVGTLKYWDDVNHCSISTMYLYLGFSRACGSSRARPAGFFSASSWVSNSSSASTLPCYKKKENVSREFYLFSLCTRRRLVHNADAITKPWGSLPCKSASSSPFPPLAYKCPRVEKQNLSQIFLSVLSD